MPKKTMFLPTKSATSGGRAQLSCSATIGEIGGSSTTSNNNTFHTALASSRFPTNADPSTATDLSNTAAAQPTAEPLEQTRSVEAAASPTGAETVGTTSRTPAITTNEVLTPIKVKGHNKKTTMLRFDGYSGATCPPTAAPGAVSTTMVCTAPQPSTSGRATMMFCMDAASKREGTDGGEKQIEAGGGTTTNSPRNVAEHFQEAQTVMNNLSGLVVHSTPSPPESAERQVKRQREEGEEAARDKNQQQRTSGMTDSGGKQSSVVQCSQPLDRDVEIINVVEEQREQPPHPTMKNNNGGWGVLAHVVARRLSDNFNCESQEEESDVLVVASQQGSQQSATHTISQGRRRKERKPRKPRKPRERRNRGGFPLTPSSSSRRTGTQSSSSEASGLRGWLASTRTSATQQSSQQQTQQDIEVPQEELSLEQQFVVDQVVGYNRSVFITGGAGTGKSLVLKHIIAQSNMKTTYVTGSTGIAAVNVGGVTLHSFAGCGLVDTNTLAQIVLARCCGKRRKDWLTCERLIIDEISMVDGDLFQKLDFAARRIRNNVYPFGGIQLVLCGDFLQLPPVRKSSTGADNARLYCFQTPAWDEVNPRICQLSTIFRQENTEFQSLLRDLRVGYLSRTMITTLNGISIPTNYRLFDERTGAALDVMKEVHGEENTVLRGKHVEVDKINTDALRKERHGKTSYRYDACDSNEHSMKDCIAPKHLELCEGCKIMLVQNLDVRAGLVNGTIGKVTGFVAADGSNMDSGDTNALKRVCRSSPPEDAHFPIVSFFVRGKAGVLRSSKPVIITPHEWSNMRGDVVEATRTQIPLRLAWAITIHKCQGMTLKNVNVDLQDLFESGMAYVALSRAQSLEGLTLLNFQTRSIKVCSAAMKFYEDLDKSGVGKCELAEADEECSYPWGAKEYEEGLLSQEDDVQQQQGFGGRNSNGGEPYDGTSLQQSEADAREAQKRELATGVRFTRAHLEIVAERESRRLQHNNSRAAALPQNGFSSSSPSSRFLRFNMGDSVAGATTSAAAASRGTTLSNVSQAAVDVSLLRNCLIVIDSCSLSLTPPDILHRYACHNRLVVCESVFQELAFCSQRSFRVEPYEAVKRLMERHIIIHHCYTDHVVAGCEVSSEELRTERADAKILRHAKMLRSLLINPFQSTPFSRMDDDENHSVKMEKVKTEGKDAPTLNVDSGGKAHPLSVELPQPEGATTSPNVFLWTEEPMFGMKAMSEGLGWCKSM